MSKTYKVKVVRVDPFKIPEGHADWRKRKMGVMTAKGRKIPRAVRNRFTSDDLV